MISILNIVFVIAVLLCAGALGLYAYFKFFKQSKPPKRAERTKRAKKRAYADTEYFKQTHLKYSEIRGNRGRFGEYAIYRELTRALNLDETQARFLFNVYLLVRDDETTEIDVMLIHPTGIYVFESKNYSGWIYGKAGEAFWLEIMRGGRKYPFFNPIIQNEVHIKYLSKALARGGFTVNPEDIHPYVVFGNDCVFKNVTFRSKTRANMPIVKLSGLAKHMRNKVSAGTYARVLDAKQISALYDALYPYTQVDDSVKEKHVARIRAKIAKKATTTIAKSAEQNTEN